MLQYCTINTSGWLPTRPQQAPNMHKVYNLMIHFVRVLWEWYLGNGNAHVYCWRLSGFFSSVVLLTDSHLSMDIQSHVWSYSCLHINRSDIKSQVKWAVRLVIANFYVNLSRGLCGYAWVTILILFPRVGFCRNIGNQLIWTLQWHDTGLIGCQ